MDLVSVIIPYYKKKNFVKEAILSVLNQTYQNLEIFIIYDDECLDDLDFIKEIKNLDKRINLIINTKKLGVGLSRNLAIKSAKGTYIAFLDSDDIWKKNKIKKQIKFMKKFDISISHTSYEIIDVKDRVIGYRKAKKYNDFFKLLKSCDIGLSTVMLKKSLFTKNLKFPKIKTKEDFVLWLKIIKKDIKIYSVNDNLTSWRKSRNSLSSSTLQKLKDGFLVYNHYMKFGYLKSLYYLIIMSLNYLRKQ